MSDSENTKHKKNTQKTNNWQKPVHYSNDLKELLDHVKSQIKEVNIDQVEDLINNKKIGEDFYLIDVRDKEEFDQAHIENSLFISRGFLEFKIPSLIPNTNSHIILYCGSGGRSAFAAENLERMGYSNVYSMAGGIKSWYLQGKPVIG